MDPVGALSSEGSLVQGPKALVRDELVELSPNCVGAQIRDQQAIGRALPAEVVQNLIDQELPYAIGIARPTSVMVTSYGTGKLADDRLAAIVQKVFDLRPKGIIQSLDLLRPIYAKTAAYGHFGRDEPEFSWEATDKVEALRAAAGL